MNPPKHILITRLSSIGDIVLTTPLIRSVKAKFPEAEITFLVKKQFSELVRYNPCIDKVIEYDKSEGELNRVRKIINDQKFDWFLDIHKSLRTRFLRYFSNASYKSGYHKQVFKRQLLVWFGANHFKAVKPVYLRYFDAVASKGIIYDGKGTEVYTRKEDATEVEKQLNLQGLEPEKPFVVLCPGASYLNKQWLPGRFAEVGKDIENKGYGVVLLGGQNDAELCESIRKSIGEGCCSLAGKLKLTESAALLKKAKLVITNDSGMMHLAQSQKVPIVAIFGPTTLELGFFPLPEDSIVVEKQVSCRPCTAKGLNYCPKKHFNCMNLITTDDVLRPAKTFLP